jgi:hypothetical protein
MLAPGEAVAAGGFVVTEGCHEHEAFVAGDDAAVAARLPDDFTAVRTSGRPLVFARAIRCEQFDGAPGTLASYGIVVETPDGRGCASGAPVAGQVKGDFPPACNLYALAFASDRADIAAWLGDLPATHAPDLAFALDGSAFRLRAPGWGIEATNAPERPGEISIRRAYRHGTGLLLHSSETLVAGSADGKVTAEPGSEVAALIGGAEAPYAEPYNSFAAERQARGVFRLQELSPAPGAHAFAGSCAVEGDVTFTPPARNQPAPGTYDYQGTGTCSGTLDGAEVQDAPVFLRHSGPAQVSCVMAYTRAPGPGVMTFADGRSIGYTVDFTTTLTEVDGTLYGERSGIAPAHATFFNARTSPDVTLTCGGDGTQRAALDLSFTTDTPLVGAAPAPAATEPPAAPSARTAALRLRVSPRRVRAGRRTAFVFRVRAGAQPVRDAVVRFAGRRVRTGARGRARIVASLRRGHTARVVLPGFASARARVRLR